MQTIVKTTKPQDLLALVPHLVGFHPSNSLVLVAFRGKRTGGAYRVDLPAPASDLVYKRIATTLIGMLCRVQGADGVVPVIYTDDRFDECGGIPRETLARRLISRARSAGFDVKEALCVAQDGWGSYFDDEAVGPQPLAMIDESGAHDVFVGVDERPLKTPRERATLPSSTLLRQEAVARQIERLRAEFARCFATGPDPVGQIAIGRDPAMVLDGWTNPVGVAEMAISWRPDDIDPAGVALIVLAAQLPRIRDVLLYDWAWGAEAGRTAHAANLRYARGGLLDEDEDGMLALAGMGMPRPDPKRIKLAIELLDRVAADAPRSTRPPLLTMLGWLHWALGSGSTAGLHIDAALAIDPDYGLADLVDTMLSQGLLPEWAFDRPEPDRDERIVSLPVDDDAER
jgi:hypothetical protein